MKNMTLCAVVLVVLSISPVVQADVLAPPQIDSFQIYGTVPEAKGFGIVGEGYIGGLYEELLSYLKLSKDHQSSSLINSGVEEHGACAFSLKVVTSERGLKDWSPDFEFQFIFDKKEDLVKVDYRHFLSEFAFKGPAASCLKEAMKTAPTTQVMTISLGAGQELVRGNFIECAEDPLLYITSETVCKFSMKK